MARDIDVETAPINSSYVVLFHAAILFVAPFVTAVFPAGLRDDALMVAIVFPVTLFWFSYLIKQFVSSSLTLNIVIGVAFVTAALSLLNAVYGHLSADSVPVIYTEVPFFATLLAGLSGPVGLIYAGTILTYGAYAYIFCVALASLFENVYEKYLKPVLPAGLQKKLRTLDASVDKAATRASDRFFVFNQTIGFVICLALIALYALLYSYLLIR